MPVVRDATWKAFDEAMDTIEGGVRLEDVRTEPITQGRAEVSLFMVEPGDPRSHPHLHMGFAQRQDPAPPALPPIPAWPTVTALRKWLKAALADPALLAGLDTPPAASPRHWFNSIRGQRITALLDHTRAAIDERDDWSASEREAGQYVVVELGDLAFAGLVNFDDENTGTYHSYQRDEPFVHVFEQIRASLPSEDSEAYALLPKAEQESIDRQRQQLDNHIDFLMRHKYAFAGITETDIEKTLGGLLIDRETRQVASEQLATKDTLQPRHELIRIDPASQHDHAGAWLMRTATGYSLRDGTVIKVDEDQLVTTPVAPERLTFERAPNDPRLRAGVRFDWNSDGWVDSRPIPWLAWAGHCDVKAVLEAVGLALLDQPTLHEYRSDTGEVLELSQALLLELLTSICELGSVAARLDGRGTVTRGIHTFGGARNDSLPDRIEFQGAGPNQRLRWPISDEREAMEFTRLTEGSEVLDLAMAFARDVADTAAVDFAPNPRYLRSLDGDDHMIDGAGLRVAATIRVSHFDAQGQLVHDLSPVVLDLRASATGRSMLGTQLLDAGDRTLHRVYLDRAKPAIVAELWRWDPDRGVEVHDPSGDLSYPLASPLKTSLIREQRLDDPADFEPLIDLALRRGQNICADTDNTAPVWNGVVTAIRSNRVAINRSERTEHWKVEFTARFGVAILDYLVRRAADGAPESYCPVPNAVVPSPDFLWQDLPDIASKAVEDGVWEVNLAMLQRKLVFVERAANQPGGWRVEDDHIEQIFELVYASLAGYRWTVVHQNHRYGFTDKQTWKAARASLEQLRSKLRFT